MVLYLWYFDSSVLSEVWFYAADDATFLAMAAGKPWQCLLQLVLDSAMSRLSEDKGASQSVVCDLFLTAFVAVSTW